MGAAVLPWLVVIDMQQVFADASSDWAVDGYDGAARRIEGLLPHFSGRAVFTRFVADPAEWGSWADYYDRWSTMRRPPSWPRWELTIAPGEAPVVSLSPFSKWGADLAELTGETSPLVVCGVATDCCVLATVLGAVDSGRRITVVEDACAGVSARHHAETLSLLTLLEPMVSVVPADRVMDALRLETSAG